MEQPFLGHDAPRRQSIPRKPLPRNSSSQHLHDRAVSPPSTENSPAFPASSHVPPPVGAKPAPQESSSFVTKAGELLGVRSNPVNPDLSRQDVLYEPLNADGSSYPDDKPKKRKTSRRSQAWQPRWLRRRTLGLFLAIFLVAIVALPVMLYFSQRDEGLFPTQSRLVYLWRFGPTGILTLITVLWARVELQSLRYLPLLAMETGMSLGPDPYNLDYTRLLPVVVPFEALRRRHWSVFLAAMASVILKVLIVLSPGLFFLATITVEVPVQVRVHDTFPLNNNATAGGFTGAYYAARSLQDFNMSFPFGVAEKAAYQTFSLANGPHAGDRGTIDAPLTVVVDGVFVEAKCLQMNDFSVNITAGNGFGVRQYFAAGFNLQFDGCSVTMQMQGTFMQLVEGMNEDHHFWGYYSPLTPDRPCSSLPHVSPQYLYFAGAYGPSPQNESHPEIHTAAAVICGTEAWRTKVRVVDDGYNPNVTEVRRRSKAVITTDMAELVRVSVPGNLGGSWGASHGSVTGPLQANRRFDNGGVDVEDISLYRNDVLEDAIVGLTRRLGPMVSHGQLRQDGGSGSGTEVTGFRTEKVDRLKVNENICLAMTALFGVEFVIALCMLLRYGSAVRLHKQDPATILGNITFFNTNRDFCAQVAAGNELGNNGTNNWSSSSYTALTLQTWYRSVFLLFMVGIITTLGITLDMSESQGGLATVDEDGFLSLMWTSFPALIMLLVSLYTASADTAIRERATLSRLSTRPSSSDVLDLSLLDMLGLRALYHSVRLRIPAVTLSQTLALFTGFLTMLSAILFTVEAVPESTHVQVPQVSWFGDRELNSSTDPHRTTRFTVSGLLLQHEDANFTYPRDTYGDLVFPKLGNITLEEPNANLTIKVTVPAAQVQPSCVKLESPQIEVSTGNWTEVELGVPRTFYNATIRQHFTCPNGTDVSLASTLYPGGATERLGESYIAELLTSPGNTRSIAGLCSIDIGLDDFLYTPYRVQTYAWGKFLAPTMELDHLSVYRCNYSWYEVPTEVHLGWVDGQVVIDHAHPPVANASASKPWEPLFGIPHFEFTSSSRDYGNAFPQVGIPDPLAGGINDQFRAIIKPNGQLPLAAMGDPNRDDDVLEFLHHNLGFVTAQLANVEYRLDLDEESVTEPSRVGDLPDVEVVITNNSRHRLVQSRNVTAVIMMILTLVAIVNAWALISTLIRRHISRGARSWLLDMELRGLAPDGFTSMAKMASLLRDSNIFGALPESFPVMSRDAVHKQVLAGAKFRMGWFRREDDQSVVYTVGMLGQPGVTFLGNKEDVGEVPWRGDVPGGDVWK